ncbi:MAG TPA: transposase [Lautropia sp.]|nr:transposase [Lautropia sp.]
MPRRHPIPPTTSPSPTPVERRLRSGQRYHAPQQPQVEQPCSLRSARPAWCIKAASKRSRDFITLLERLDHLYGPASNRPTPPVVLVLDNGPIHTSKATTKALAARPWLTVEWLPKYTPELNAIEHCWQDLKGNFLAHQTFASVDRLDAAIHQAVVQRNQERQSQTCSALPKAA